MATHDNIEVDMDMLPLANVASEEVSDHNVISDNERPFEALGEQNGDIATEINVRSEIIDESSLPLKMQVILRTVKM